MENWILVLVLLSALGFIVWRRLWHRRRNPHLFEFNYEGEPPPVPMPKPRRVPPRDAKGRPTADRRPADDGDVLMTSIVMGSALDVEDDDRRREGNVHHATFGGGHSDGGGSSGSYSSDSGSSGGDSGGGGGGGGD